jgi:PAS domain-containing protein
MNDSYCVGLNALDNFDMAVARFDRNGVLTYQNDAAADLFGVPRDTRLDIETLFPNADERERVIEQMRVRAAGKSSVYRTAFHPPKGAPGAPDIPVSVFALPDSDTEGKVMGSITLLRDLREECARERIHATIETSTKNDDMFAGLAEHVRALLDFEEMRIVTISKSRAHLRRLYTTNDKADTRYPFRWWPLPPFLHETRHEWRALVMEVDEMLADPHYQALLERDEATRNFLHSGVRQVLSLPVYDENRVVAFFSLDSRVDRRYDEESVRLLQRLPVAQAVLAAMHREQRDQQTHMFRLIRDIGKMSHNVQGVARKLVRRLVDDFGWAHVSIFQCDSSHRQFRLVSQANMVGKPVLPKVFEVSGDRESSAIIEAAITEQLVNVRETRSRGPLAGVAGADPAGSQLALPIKGRKVQWILNIESIYENAFSTEEVDLLQVLAGEASSVLLRSAMFELQQAVLSSINDAVIETNAAGIIRWSNRASHNLLGLVPDVSPPMCILDLVADAAVREKLLETPQFDHVQVNMRSIEGQLIPVLLSGTTLPAHLSGRVYVISDYTYQKEVLRLTDVKDVFRQAAMEGRVPLALASVWLRELAEQSPEMHDAVEKITAQLGRADLPLERLMRLFSAETVPVAAPRADLNRALKTTLSELPQSLAREVDPVIDGEPLPVGIAFDNLQFCVESMISFGLRTRPQSKKLQVRSERKGAEALFSVSGDWQPDLGAGDQTGPAEQTRRKSLSDLTLGDSVIERIITAGKGHYDCDLHQSLCLRFALPVLAD